MKLMHYINKDIEEQSYLQSLSNVATLLKVKVLQTHTNDKILTVSGNGFHEFSVDFSIQRIMCTFALKNQSFNEYIQNLVQ